MTQQYHLDHPEQWVLDQGLDQIQAITEAWAKGFHNQRDGSADLCLWRNEILFLWRIV